MSNDTEMIPWDELFPGSLNAESIGEGNTIIVTIESLRHEEVSEIGAGRKPTGKKVMRPVMKFADYGDWWVLNATNKGLIGKCLGTSTREWKGKQIALTSIATQFFGGTLAIRVSGGEGMATPVKTKIAVSQSRNIDWTMAPINPPAPRQDQEAERTKRLEKIAAGEKHIGPEAVAEVRAAFGADDSSPETWNDDTQRAYLDLLVKRAKG